MAPERTNRPWVAVSGRRAFRVLLVAAVIGMPLGCQSQRWVKVRRVPADPLAQRLNLLAWAGPQPTARVEQWLRRHDLRDELDGPPQELISRVQRIVAEHSSNQNIYALAELSYLSGKKLQRRGDTAGALDMFGISVANAYAYLLEERRGQPQNPFDPQFRQASDLYNGALENALRMAQAQGPIRPGKRHTIRTSSQVYQLAVVSRGNWEGLEVERLEFVSDYQVLGLTNHYQTFGLGVPLMAVCRHRPDDTGAPGYYAPGMSVPMTAFLRVVEPLAGESSPNMHFCVLELYDPLVTTSIDVDGRSIPLETDLTTPLAYTLNQPAFQTTEIATRGLINPRGSQAMQGLYMLEPYDRNKIPVLMVHGFWSSLITWMEMFNDLRGEPEIRDHFQFWFYLYPTGQPFWLTAGQLREDLQKALEGLDPSGSNPSLRRMVLVGHSMGGLICKLQTLESRQDYWHLVSDQPLDALKLEPAQRDLLERMLFFHPSPYVSRVIMIASPHGGSRFANDTTRWLGHQIIRLPEVWMDTTERLLTGQEDWEDSPLLRIKTSIDSLAPDSPMLPVVRVSPKAPWVRYHNVVGVLPKDKLLGRVVEVGDGVVELASAHVDDVDSELQVPADHLNIHRHPRTVLEVQRILLLHLTQMQADQMYRLPAVAIAEPTGVSSR